MYLCLACNKEIDPNDPRISDNSHPNYGGCPECGHRGIPADADDKVEVKITWHELPRAGDLGRALDVSTC